MEANVTEVKVSYLNIKLTEGEATCLRNELENLNEECEIEPGTAIWDLLDLLWSKGIGG